MKTVSIRFSDMDKKTLLYLGYVGENLHRRILIDCKREFEEMPGAIPALVVTAPNGLKYPVDVTVEGNTVIWDITNSDLIHHGNGEIQLTLTKDSEVGKSAKCRTKVDESIEPDGEAPDPIENWLIRAENLLKEIPEEIADAIDEAKESGLFDGVGISSIGYVRTVGNVNIYRINLTDGSFYDFEVSNGEDGQPGTNGVGIANIAKTGTVGLVDTYTITLTNGQTYPFTVTNGQNGAEIDDTTPALNKVFSSFKVNEELTQLKSAIQEKYTKPNTGIPSADIANGVIPVVHNIPSGGTTGKVLKKASETDYDVTWGDVAAPTNEQVASAVEGWLDDHPEATTTVQDDSVTISKLYPSVADSVEGVNPLVDYFGVAGKTLEAFTTEKIAHPRKVTFIGNEYAFTNCRVANRKNYISKVDSGELSLNGVTLKRRAGVLFYELNGTCTGTTEGSTVWDSSVFIPAGTYRYFVEVDPGQSIITTNASFKIQYKYVGESSYNSSNIWIGTTSGYIDITFTKDVIAINPRVAVFNGNVYNKFFVWFGLYKSDVTIIDTNETVGNGETQDYTFTSTNVFEVIDTMQHKSVVEFISKTGNVIPFVTPEMFGAKGDGSANDSVPLQNCIDYAVANKCMVYGKGKYLIRQKITISSNYGIYRINWIGAESNFVSGYALEVSGSSNIIEINMFNNTTGKGILVTDGLNGTKNNLINVRYILTSGDGITIEGGSHYTSYNQFFFGNIYSYHGNCVANNVKATENWVYGGMMICPEGWAFYNPRSMRVFSASFESQCFGGIYAGNSTGGEFYGIRMVELVNKLENWLLGRSEYNGGILIKFVGYDHSINFHSSNSVPYQAIDTSECTDCTDPTVYDDIDYQWRPYHRMFYSSINKNNIMCQVCYGYNDSINGGFLLGDSMSVFAGKKVCKPGIKSSFTINIADYDMRDNYTSQSNNLVYPTRFVIDVADCVIHLASSYCCEGYTEFIVDQSDSSKLCTIYKSYDDQTPIFDGHTLGAGVYRLTCECDYDATTDVLPDGWANSYTTTFYTGYNDKWTVEKIA